VRSPPPPDIVQAWTTTDYSTPDRHDYNPNGAPEAQGELGVSLVDSAAGAMETARQSLLRSFGGLTSIFSRSPDPPNGHTNGHTNGYTNGYTNGHSNGHSNSNGFSNGQYNGHSNGHSNGTAPASPPPHHSMRVAPAPPAMPLSPARHSVAVQSPPAVTASVPVASRRSTPAPVGNLLQSPPPPPPPDLTPIDAPPPTSTRSRRRWNEGRSSAAGPVAAGSHRPGPRADAMMFTPLSRPLDTTPTVPRPQTQPHAAPSARPLATPTPPHAPTEVELAPRNGATERLHTAAASPPITPYRPPPPPPPALPDHHATLSESSRGASPVGPGGDSSVFSKSQGHDDAAVYVPLVDTGDWDDDDDDDDELPPPPPPPQRIPGVPTQGLRDWVSESVSMLSDDESFMALC